MYEKEKTFIKKIVKKAYSKIIKKHKYDVMSKGEKDVVTSLDLKNEEYIISNIKKYFPHDNIVSEEYNSAAKLIHRSWVIDPIDGTVNFARDFCLWCIQMAFVDNGRVITSVIYIPKLNELYYADDKGAWCNDKPINVNKNAKINQSIFAHGQIKAGYNAIRSVYQDTQKNIETEILKYRNLGSAGIEYALVASGKMDAEVIWADNVWDYLPGSFLCQQAGGLLYDTIIKGKLIHAVFANEELKNIFEKKLKNVLKQK